MRYLRSAAIASVLLIGSVATASAQGYGYGVGPRNEIDARQARQMDRIGQGYRDGSLTGREAAGLVQQQRAIAGYESRAKADGRLDPYERHNLRVMQNHASRSIARERHDFEGRMAPVHRPWWRRWH